jgi:hypothetical protein
MIQLQQQPTIPALLPTARHCAEVYYHSGLTDLILKIDDGPTLSKKSTTTQQIARIKTLQTKIWTNILLPALVNTKNGNNQAINNGYWWLFLGSLL